MNSTARSIIFQRGRAARKKVDKKNKTSQIWKSGEASQPAKPWQAKDFFFLLQKNLKVEGRGSQPEKNPVKLETL